MDNDKQVNIKDLEKENDEIKEERGFFKSVVSFFSAVPSSKSKRLTKSSINLDADSILSEEEARIEDDIENGKEEEIETIIVAPKDEELGVEELKTSEKVEDKAEGEVESESEEEEEEEEERKNESAENSNVIKVEEREENETIIREVEMLELQQKSEEEVEEAKEVTRINKRKTPEGILVEGNIWTRNVTQPLKDFTGIETFDIYHLLMFIFVLLCFVMIGTLPFIMTAMADTEVGVGYSPLAAVFQRSIIQSGGVRKKIWGGKVFRWPRTDQIIEYTNDDNTADVLVVDSRSQTTSVIERLYCNSKDGLEIEMDAVVNLRIIESQIKRLTQTYGEFSTWFELVTLQIRSSSLNFCQQVTAFDFQTKRKNVTERLEEFVHEQVFNRFRGDVRRVALINIRRPDQFEDALIDLENRRSTIDLANAEREQAIIQAETKLDIAANEAIRIIDTAETNGRIIRDLAGNVAIATTDRLEKLGEVFKEVQSKALLSANGTLTYIESQTLLEDMTLAIDVPVEINFKVDL